MRAAGRFIIRDTNLVTRDNDTLARENAMIFHGSPPEKSQRFCIKKNHMDIFKMNLSGKLGRKRVCRNSNLSCLEIIISDYFINRTWHCI